MQTNLLNWAPLNLLILETKVNIILYHKVDIKIIHKKYTQNSILGGY